MVSPAPIPSCGQREYC